VLERFCLILVRRINDVQKKGTLLLCRPMKNVVVIDDDDDVRDVIVYALETDGFSVLPFENGRHGYEALLNLEKKDYPGLIIVDYMMPEMDGMSFISEIRSKHAETLGKIPIAMSSAMGTVHPSFSGQKNLILLPKPMDLDYLLEVARSYCCL
jgi:DNA-binding response OmpR family regulator